MDNNGVPKKRSSGKPDKTKEEIIEDNNLIYVSAYPNPADDYATIEYKVLSSRQPMTVSVFDQVGRKIDSWQISGQNEGQLIWDTRKASSGMYLIELLQEGEVIDTGKLMINH